jgi:hypothetical protein
MCQFFSAIVCRDGRLLFGTTDSHEDLIKWYDLDDTADLFTRRWVRVECRPPHTAVVVDETVVPAWYDEDRAAYEGRVMEAAETVANYRAAYEAVRGPAWAAYEAVTVPAQAAYEAVEGPAWAAYGAVTGPARAAYEAQVSALARRYAEGAG